MINNDNNYCLIIKIFVIILFSFIFFTCIYFIFHYRIYIYFHYFLLISRQYKYLSRIELFRDMKHCFISVD